MDHIVPEEFIRDTVKEKINSSHYKQKTFLAETEVYTKNHHRADVFLAFPYSKEKVYTVVIEAKSRKTIHALRFGDDRGKRLLYARWIVGFLFIGIVTSLYVNKHKYILDGPTSWLIALFFGIGWVLFADMLKFLGFRFTKSIPVIDQLKQYPANEKWLAIAYDSISAKKELKRLKKELKNRGIGLIIVDKKERLRIEQLPKPSYKKIKSEYLSHYLYEDLIRDNLKERKPSYRSTPAQNAKRVKWVIYIVFVLSLIIIFFILSHQNSQRPY